MDKNILAYLDTDVVSRLASGKLPDFETMICASNLVPLYSSVLISESISKPSYEEKIATLDRLKACRVESDDSHASGLKVWDERASDYVSRCNESNVPVGMENALDQFLLFAHGSQSGVNRNQVFRQFEEATIKLLEQLYSEMDILSHSYKEPLKALVQGITLERVFEDDFSSEDNRLELEELVQNYKSVASFRPPKVIEKVLRCLPEDAREELQRKIAGVDPSFGDLIEAAVLLGILGYNRDSRIGSDKQERASRGARSDRHDTQHIAFGVLCRLFFTGDKRSARKAFALSEHYRLGAVIAFVEENGRVNLVSESFWP